MASEFIINSQMKQNNIEESLRPVFNAAKVHPDYRCKCKLEGSDLIIKGKKLHNLTELPEDLSGHKVTSRTSNNVTCFFGELNPLSNFHRCCFTCNGITFSSSEQFIQYTKCKYFNNNELVDRILKTDDAFQCKSLARDVRYSTDKARWSDVA